MPLCYIFTNLNDGEIATNLEDNLRDCIASVLQKPADKISIVINSGLRMLFAGSNNEPGLMCQIHSINVFDEKRNGGYFPAFFDVLAKATKLPKSSITIELVDLPKHMAMNGSALDSS